MKPRSLLGLLLLGALQAASGSARHLSDFAGKSQVAPLGQLDQSSTILGSLPGDSASTHARALKQVEPSCPIPGCDPSRCELVTNGNEPGYKCSLCQNTLILKDNACWCPEGRYGAYLTCVDCPKGSYCPGGKYTVTTTQSGTVVTPDKIACPTVQDISDPANPIVLTTAGSRSTSIAKCVNPPGTFYVAPVNGGQPSATRCPVNTYGPGFKKQRACVPCPSGYTTDKDVNNVITAQSRQDKKSACVVPEGYFLKSLGSVARCQPGEWKSGLGAPASCTKCAQGVTTASDGSIQETDCTVIRPSYYAKTIRGDDGVVTVTELCPLGSYCQGGQTRNTRRHLLQISSSLLSTCPAGTYTDHEGASSLAECLVPPGYYNSGANQMLECPANTYRAEWKPPSVATLQACLSCGEGVSAQGTEQVMVPTNLNDPSTSAMTQTVKASASSCYIKPGQGMLKLPSGTFKAVWCDANNYGASGDKFGLEAAPCTACPNNMVTIKPTGIPSFPAPSGPPFYSDADGSAGGDGGFTDPKACVTKPGYGYDGRISYKCPPGSFNEGGNRKACQQCPYGRTTTDIATQQTSEANCGIAPGFGFHDNAIVPCPVGTYNNAIRANLQTPCDACPEFTSTSSSGAQSTAACDLCQAGYGHDVNGPRPNYQSGNPENPSNNIAIPNCRLQCGTSPTSAATYGAGGQPIGTPCAACPAIRTGFYFAWQSANQPYIPAVVAPLGSDSAGDCLAEFGQVGDVGAWYVGGAAILDDVADVTSLVDCVANCKADPDCEYITFDYKVSKCQKKKNSVADKEYAGLGGEVMAYKAILAADPAAASINTTAKALSSGRYSFYWESSTPIGTPSEASEYKTGTTRWTFQECLNACDGDGDCLAAGMTKVAKAATIEAQAAVEIGSCRVVKGVPTPGVGKRSVTKVDLARMSLPATPDTACGTECTGGSTPGTCAADASTLPSTSGWFKCNCAANRQWDPVVRQCRDYIPVLLDDRRFMVFTTAKPYTQAHTACLSESAMLATMRSQDETDKLLAKTTSTGANFLWMGLTNTLPPNWPNFNPGTTNKAKWMWLSTTVAPEWDHWAAQANFPYDPEPNRWNNNEGQCAGIWGPDSDSSRPKGFWNDSPCWDQLWYICEK